MFSPVTAEMEQRAAAIVAEEVPGIRLSLSHEIGRIGLLERENAAVMNACLVELASRIVHSFRRALAELSQGAVLHQPERRHADGAEYVEKYPVLTFASGPTNTMRGAAFLSGLKDAMVVDIGGTTSDVGVLIRGFPREASVAVDIGGVRTNFRMPDVLSSAWAAAASSGRRAHRPRAVGYEITSKALVFGGDVLTTTDIAVAAGLENIGDRSRVKHWIRTRRDRAGHDPSHGRHAVDRMKTSAEPCR